MFQVVIIKQHTNTVCVDGQLHIKKQEEIKHTHTLTLTLTSWSLATGPFYWIKILEIC